MGFQWRGEWLKQQMEQARRRLPPDAPPALDPMFAHLPSGELTLNDLAGLCQAFECQLSDLLFFTRETPAEQAARALESDLSYQSFLAHQARQAVEEALEQSWDDAGPKN